MEDFNPLSGLELTSEWGFDLYSLIEYFLPATVIGQHRNSLTLDCEGGIQGPSDTSQVTLSLKEFLPHPTLAETFKITGTLVADRIYAVSQGLPRAVCTIPILFRGTYSPGDIGISSVNLQCLGSVQPVLRPDTLDYAPVHELPFTPEALKHLQTTGVTTVRDLRRISFKDLYVASRYFGQLFEFFHVPKLYGFELLPHKDDPFFTIPLVDVIIRFSSPYKGELSYLAKHIPITNLTTVEELGQIGLAKIKTHFGFNAAEMNSLINSFTQHGVVPQP